MNLSYKKMTKSDKARVFIVCLILLFDLIFLPWFLKFPIFLGKNYITAPTEWAKYGIFRSLRDVFIDAKFRKLVLCMQLPIFTLIISVAWNVDRLKKKNKIIDGVGGPEPTGYGQQGTSRWLNKREMDETFNVWFTDTKPPRKGGIILGMEKANNKGSEKTWFNNEDTHTLIIGATRSGKDRKILLPSIWELAQSGESMVIGDPKGDMYISAKEFLEKQGYNVIVMNFRDPLKGNRWNILHMVNEAIDNNDIPKATEYAWDIANIMGKLTPYTDREPIWKNGSESTIAALILLASMESDFKNQRHMTTAYYLLSEYGQPLEDESIPLLDYIKCLPVRHPAKAAFATASIAPYKTRASFFTTVLSDLRLFSDPTISDMTSTQDHDFESIGIDKTAVFLIIPDEKNTRNVLANLYVSQVYQSLVNLSNRRGGRIPRRVNIILNEFGNLPAFPDFPTMLTVGGGRGIKFTLAVQDVAQIKTLYKETSQTIQGNCSTWIFLKTADVDTAELISKKTGKYTVQTENVSSSIQRKNYGSSHGLSTTGRSLLMPDEVLRWNINESLVLPTGTFPARYPLLDLSQCNANDDFGFVKPSGNIDNDIELNRQIIENRWNDIPGRNLADISIWLPDLLDEVSNNLKNNKNKKSNSSKIHNQDDSALKDNTSDNDIADTSNIEATSSSDVIDEESYNDNDNDGSFLDM